MAVVGHAFVGLAIGLWPAPCAESRSRSGAPRAPLWLPSVVALAYLPDIVTQVLLLGGWHGGGLVGHSVLFGVTASALAAAGLIRLAPVSRTRAFVTALLAIVFHDLLDLFEASDRAPFWPLVNRRFGFEVAILPADSVGETVLYGSAFLVFLVGRRLAQRLTRDPALRLPAASGSSKPPAWRSATVTAAIVTAALVTHSLRDARERHLVTARALVEQRRFQAALEVLTRAEPWPSTAKAGRIDYLRAEAYAGLGDREHAEVHYLRAYEADPTYFWAVADLALFYASTSGPAAERRRLTEPYVRRLRADFAGHAALPQVLARLEDRLARPPASQTRGSVPRNGQFGS